MMRAALLVTHTGRSGAITHARRIATQLRAAGFAIRVLAAESEEEAIEDAEVVAGLDAAAGAEIVIALGGDGTLLRAAESARAVGAPLLGVNLGHVGFLAEADVGDVPEVVARIAARDYVVDERVTVEVTIYDDGQLIAADWALNEVSLERALRERVLDAAVSIDGDVVSRWGCDGVLVATPTGSTAYAFSAGGPVMWPSVPALLVVPVSAHALFNRPLVVGLGSQVVLQAGPRNPAVVSCDGRRTYHLAGQAEVVVRAGERPVRVVRLAERSFTDRLVAKFGLNVDGWRRSDPRPDGDL